MKSDSSLTFIQGWQTATTRAVWVSRALPWNNHPQEFSSPCLGTLRELLHDGHPTVCVADAALACVNAFKAHVNVGFFRGAEIAGPEGLLEGTDKFLRHVKLRLEREVDGTALMKVVATAYIDLKGRLKGEQRARAFNNYWVLPDGRDNV